MNPILIYNVAWLCPLHYISNRFEEDEINNNNNNNPSRYRPFTACSDSEFNFWILRIYLDIW